MWYLLTIDEAVVIEEGMEREKQKQEEEGRIMDIEETKVKQS